MFNIILRCIRYVFLIWYLLTYLYQWALDVHIQGFWIRNMQFCKGVIYTDYLKMHKKRYVFSWLMILVCGFSKIILNANIQLLPFRFQCITVKRLLMYEWQGIIIVLLCPLRKLTSVIMTCGNVFYLNLCVTVTLLAVV